MEQRWSSAPGAHPFLIIFRADLISFSHGTDERWWLVIGNGGETDRVCLWDRAQNTSSTSPYKVLTCAKCSCLLSNLLAVVWCCCYTWLVPPLLCGANQIELLAPHVDLHVTNQIELFLNCWNTFITMISKSEDYSIIHVVTHSFPLM